MPSETEKQRRMFAIAEHEPEKLYKRNRGVLGMSKEKMHEFSTKPVLGRKLHERTRHGK